MCTYMYTYTCIQYQNVLISDWNVLFQFPNCIFILFIFLGCLMIVSLLSELMNHVYYVYQYTGMYACIYEFFMHTNLFYKYVYIL